MSLPMVYWGYLFIGVGCAFAVCAGALIWRFLKKRNQQETEEEPEEDVLESLLE